jgi:tetratricopeptide (TPR) repeat protein
VAKALELDEFLAEAHTTKGTILSFHDWDAKEGEKEFIRAIELNPNYSTAWHRYGLPHLACLRRFAEADRALRRALEIDPLSLLTNAHLGLLLAYWGKYQAAELQLLKTLEMDPNFPEAHGFLGLVYWWHGEPDKAAAHLQKGNLLSGDSVRMRCLLAALKAHSGQLEEAKSQFDVLLREAQQRYISPVYLSLVYLCLDEIDNMFRMLELAYQERSNILPLLNAWPIVDTIRSDQRFQNLLRRLNLAA